MDTRVDDGELRKLEAAIDQWHAATALPSWDRPTAFWHILSVAEDRLQILLTKATEAILDWDQYFQNSEVFKYSLKYLLARASLLDDRMLTDFPTLTGDDYGAAFDLLERYEKYDTAVAAFSGAWAGLTVCHRLLDGSFHFRRVGAAAREANDNLESRSSSWAPTADIAALISIDASNLSPAFQASIRASMSGRIRVSFAVLHELGSHIPLGDSILPPNWVSPLGTGAQLARTIHNLYLVSIAHAAIATHTLRDAPMRGVQRVLGECTADWLVKAMCMNGGVSNAEARALIHLLTYGQDATRPDPALQFLFPLRNNLISVPWILVSTCDIERNLLALLSRLKKFDDTSGAFEEHMTADVRAAVSRRSWKARFNRTIPTKQGDGEVDVVLLDPGEGFALVCELRWFLEPSEVTEVERREKDGRHKAEQAQRKATALAEAIDETCTAEGITSRSDWQIAAVAVFAGYLPTPIPEIPVPMISHRAFLAGILHSASLRGLSRWIQNGSWLPVEGRHFTLTTENEDIGGVRLALDGIFTTPEGEDFVTARDAKAQELTTAR